MEAFPSEDHANNFKNLDLGSDTLPMQHRLGLNWDLMLDTFTFKAADEDKPFTRRGVLSTVNSIYDPLGFIAQSPFKAKQFCESLLKTMVIGIHLSLKEWKRCGILGGPH